MPHTTPEVDPIGGGVQLFRSCMVSSEYPGAEAATRWLFEKLGVEYIVNPEQTCCTGMGYYTDLMPFATTLAIAARNACVAVEAGHPVQAYLCFTCYAINKRDPPGLGGRAATGGGQTGAGARRGGVG